MPTIGNRTNSSASMGRSYAKSPIAGFAKDYLNVVTNILNENGVDLFSEPRKAMMLAGPTNAMKNFFVESAEEMARAQGITDPEEIEDAIEEATELFLNDREAVLNEYSAMNTYNPVIGMTFPIHKNIMMNTVFDKGAIPKVVAKEPNFTISMETRLLITPDGEEIDMWKDQYKMTAAIDATAPEINIDLELPQTEGQTDLLAAAGLTADDNLSKITHISAVRINGVHLKKGEIDPTTNTPVERDTVANIWVPVNIGFAPGYGDYDRQLMGAVKFVSADPKGDGSTTTITDTISGYMRKNSVALNTLGGNVSAVRLTTRVDTSSAMIETCSVSWKVRTDYVEIPEAIPINTYISPEEVKDIGALYQVNQLSKILSLMKTALGNYKDDKIKAALDESFMTMPEEAKFAGTFDFAPRAGYAFDHIEWRNKTFMDALDTYVTQMIQVLNDPNMTITVFGRPDLIRKLTPNEYSFRTPTNIGSIELDFVKTVVTSTNRVYQFISSDKLRDNNNLIILLCPRNTERITYRIYDYQMYVSNEIRNVKNYALPAIHAFERWKFVAYQPVQGRVKILNPTGLRYEVANTDPIGTSDYNDFNANKPIGYFVADRIDPATGLPVVEDTTENP